MRFDKEEIAKEESILLADSESESDYRSTTDTPWSDGSTLYSIDEKVMLSFHLLLSVITN